MMQILQVSKKLSASDKFVIPALLLLSLHTTACTTTLTRFHKQRLLDVTMDSSKTPTAVDGVSSPMLSLYEKATTTGSSNIGSSCPTCGS